MRFWILASAISKSGLGAFWRRLHSRALSRVGLGLVLTVVLFLRDNPAGQKYLTKLEKKHGKGKALTILAHKLGRAVYDMLKRHTAFDIHTFLSGSWGGADEPNA